MNKITVTSPLLPPLEELIPYLEDIWEKKWLTNNGYYHQLLENKLCDYLGVNYISLFSNGTLALLAAIQALELKGEIITTPYSFVATSHAIILNNLTPVFVDIDTDTYNLNPKKIEEAITDKTSAIMPVHVYGNLCNHKEIKRIAEKYNLKIIYDAAHAFGVKKNNISILNWGDLSILSFHATKTYSTIEGGAVICHTEEMKQKLDQLKNFGYISETEILVPSLNAKMNELQAAFGLINLNHIDQAIDKRAQISKKYKKKIDDIKGISYMKEQPNVKYNYSYFPIIIDENVYGLSRDELYNKLKDNDIISRRYFYPLITNFDFYKKSKNIIKHDISISEKVSNSVICLPLHHNISDIDVEKIISLIKN